MRTLTATALTMLFACSNIDDQLSEEFIGILTHEVMFEQGEIHFTGSGNIDVYFNNLQFKNNRAVSEASYLTAWVYRRGADPFEQCCSPAFACPDEEQNRACVQGMGFSNDLGYSGTFYLEVNPPRPFEKNTDAFTFPVYASDNAGVPTHYQGRYNTFSSTVNVVQDREQYDMYFGFFFNVMGEDGRPRVISSERTFRQAGQEYTLYSAVQPDLMSPVVRIESRFFSESPGDPEGTVYKIPHMSSWFRHPGIDDYSGTVFIADVSTADASCDDSLAPGNDCNQLDAGTPARRDYVMLYNAGDEDININGWRIFRKTQNAEFSSFITIQPGQCGNENYSAYDQPCILPAKGFFLLTSRDYTPENGARGDYIGWNDAIANSNNGIQLVDDRGSFVDAFCFGDHVETAGCPGSQAENPDSANLDSFVRKALANSTADADAETGILPGGGHRNFGHAYNTDNNAEDYLLLTLDSAGAVNRKQPRNRHTGGTASPP